MKTITHPTIATSLCIAGLSIYLTGAGSCFAQVSISRDVVTYYSNGPGENVSVTPNGNRIWISSPQGNAEETLFDSYVPEVAGRTSGDTPFSPISNLHLTELGYGEVTDVGVLPNGRWGLAVVRGDTLRTKNVLLAIRGEEILQEIPFSAKPDGMKISPDGRFAVVAVEKGGEIHVYDLERGAPHIHLAARITKAQLAAGIAAPNSTVALEPEAVGISKDSSFALVTIQDCASLASISLDTVVQGVDLGLDPNAIGVLALKKVINLPFGYRGSNTSLSTNLPLYGVDPDGVSISPDGTFAVVALEANQRAKHLQGIAVVDLHNGLEAMTATSYSIFGIDPTLLENTGLTECPDVAPGAPYPTAANNLPRLDPASVEIVNRGGLLVAAVVIERYDASPVQLAASTTNESRGSLLLLDVTNALGGEITTLDRLPIGVAGSRLEGIDSAKGGRWIFVSISNGGGPRGTVARLELIAD
jgi:hypothetical protein